MRALPRGTALLVLGSGLLGCAMTPPTSVWVRSDRPARVSCHSDRGDTTEAEIPGPLAILPNRDAMRVTCTAHALSGAFTSFEIKRPRCLTPLPIAVARLIANTTRKDAALIPIIYALMHDQCMDEWPRGVTVNFKR